jgi:hypothetical protein
MWQGKSRQDTSEQRLSRTPSRRTSERDEDRGIFVTADLQVIPRGVDAWEVEARARGQADDRSTSQEPENYYVQKVFAECQANADRLAAEAHDRLNVAPARASIRPRLEARKRFREAEATLMRRKEKLDEIDPLHVGRFGEVARICLLTFGFALEAVLIWLATYRFDFSPNQRLLAAVIVGALITGVVHVIAAYLTQQFRRERSRIGTFAIAASGLVMGIMIIVLLTGLSEIRKTDFPVLTGAGIDISSYEGWLFWILLAISVLGTMSAAIAGVAHGIEAPLRHARSDVKKAERELAKRQEVAGKTERRYYDLLDHLDNLAHVFGEALVRIPSVASLVGNEYLAPQALNHTIEANYADEVRDLEKYCADHAVAVREWRTAIDQTLGNHEREVRDDLAFGEASYADSQGATTQQAPDSPADPNGPGGVTTPPVPEGPTAEAASV